MASWFQRLKTGLTKTTNRLVESIGAALGRKRVDANTLGELEEALIAADLGPSVAAKLVAKLKQRKWEGDVEVDTVKRALAEDIAAILAPVAQPFALDLGHKPHVTVVVGVNGSGKTTTIGKFAEKLSREKRKVVIAAGDTFRAAAVAQLEIWAKRAGAECIRAVDGSDPAALAYQALERAQAVGADSLLIDTAGRLHNKADLMAELQKLVRVLRKRDETAPHRTLLVLDATTGQNALQQVEIFKQLVEIDGLVLTKLDGSARGGVLVAIAERFALPVVAIGVGESADDLASFDPKQFADALLGLEAA
jgi:fused signal recognition particle receptor